MITELTQSMINQLNKCGVQFENRYIKKIIIPPGIAARKGSSVHSGAEHDYRHKVEKGELAPLDEVQDATRDKFMTLVNDEGVWFADEDLPEKNNILNDGLNQAISASKFYHEQFAPLDKEIAVIEERLFADVGIGIPISGMPDVVADGRLIDLKTAGKRWVKGREDLEIQPTMYRILLRKNGYGDLPAEYRVLTNMKGAPRGDGLIWDKETKVCGDVRIATRTKEHEEALLARMKVMVKGINAGIFQPAYSDTWWCSPKWCGYFGSCPYAKGRKIFA